jgi:hypothetical protein
MSVAVGKLIKGNANRFLRTIYVMMKSNLAVTGEDGEHVQDYDLPDWAVFR